MYMVKNYNKNKENYGDKKKSNSCSTGKIS